MLKIKPHSASLIFKGAGVNASVSLPQRLFRPRAQSQNTQDCFRARNAPSGVAAPLAENGFLRNPLCSKCATRSNRDTSAEETVLQDRWATCSQQLACYSTKTESFAEYENTWRRFCTSPPFLLPPCSWSTRHPPSTRCTTAAIRARPCLDGSDPLPS